MKNLILTTFFCFIFQTGFCQNFSKTIKDGTCLEYVFDLHGQTRTIFLTLLEISEGLKIRWKLREQEGFYVISSEGLKEGTNMSFKQGVPSETVILKPDETFCMISQSTFKELMDNNKFVYNETTYVLKDPSAHINVEGHQLKVLHVVAKIDETEMWILDNPRYPIIAKMRKNPLGINFSLQAISKTEVLRG